MLWMLLTAIISFSNDFQPISAADQAEITVDSLEAELDQYRNLSASNRWAPGEVAEFKIQIAKENYLRHRQLLSGDFTTQLKFKEAKRDYENAKIDLKINQSRSRFHRAQAQKQQLMVKSYGNPNLDFRKQVAQVTIEALEFEIRVVEGEIIKAQNNFEVEKFRFENGSQLLERDRISLAEFDRRKFQHLLAQKKLRSWKSKKITLGRMKSSMQRSVDSL